MHTQLIQITPQLAKDYLERNPKNRNVSERLVQKYAQDIQQGQWALTHQGIAFYEDGTLADGQHRLFAIIKADLPVRMMVTSGLKQSDAINIDAHRARSAIDGIKIGGLSDWIQAKHLTMLPMITHPKRLSTHESVDMLNMLEDSAKFALKAFPTNKRYLTSSIIHAALTLAHHFGETPAKLMRFGDVFSTGLADKKEEFVIVLLREAFFNNRSGGAQDKYEKFLKAQKAIYAYCRGEEVKRLMLPKGPIYKFEVME